MYFEAFYQYYCRSALLTSSLWMSCRSLQQSMIVPMLCFRFSHLHSCLNAESVLHTMYIIYTVCICSIVMDREWSSIFHHPPGITHDLFTYSASISSLPGAILLFVYPIPQYHSFWLFVSDSDSDFVFTCVRTLHTLCGLGSAQYYAVSVFVWTIGQLIEMFAQKAKWNWKENSLEKKQRRMEKRKMSK